ncbi:hypothetical protein F441_20584 [Phytophthora nicotianae CJ01A1]|uniref:RxLR effector protein n=3 Tax=Phytophthora nicotianae TaxID=4792 RepID=W2QWS5_PHYN3|nr:hypothetical protein PPTG_21801 [Phytophthora nicotianae INRA-310]ETL79533.1 hypothetical protein L917_19864 [Phytophthora nicotianae]ETN16909.1 hypothetical protein PPTG_21801 [Phytophthora nicotianae INRA-310]ETP02335.1 hypothetical protein F441_20584 [Phytophthora nicotianae CJ01A1]KUF97461.1 hypothetical protein AM587_10009023 [Phytophthora nicotianae]
MRFAYIVVMVFAATLYDSSTALDEAKAKTSLEIVEPTNLNGERLLRRVEKPASDENEIDEERFVAKLLQRFRGRLNARAIRKENIRYEAWLAHLRKIHGINQ